MEKVNVWYTDAWRKGLQVRFNSGEAIDAGDGYGTPQGVLHFEGNLEELLKKQRTVYRFNAGHLTRHFYFSEAEAMNAAVAAGLANFKEGYVQKGHIKPASYKPISLPVQVLLEQSDRGVFCRMNLHPEIYGTHKHGKMYFPDRSCADLGPGPVVVTEVKDRSSYGFLIGHTAQFQAPSVEQISDYIMKNKLRGKKAVFCSNKFGSFVLYGGDCLVLQDGKVHVSDYHLNVYDSKYRVTNSISVSDLISSNVPWT